MEKRYVVTRELLRAAKLLRKRLEMMLAATGGSLSEFMVLDALVKEGGLNQRELATRLGIEGPTLTRHLNNLERTGLIERRPDAQDRRAFRIHLTDKGQAAYDAMYPTAKQLEIDLVSLYPPADMAKLGETLADMRRLLEADSGVGPLRRPNVSAT